MSSGDQQKPRGRVLLIANSKFTHPFLPERLGTAVDVRMLKTVFKWLNFKVDVKPDLKSQVRCIYHIET